MPPAKKALPKTAQTPAQKARIKKAAGIATNPTKWATKSATGSRKGKGYGA